MNSILLIEDEPSIHQPLSQSLRDEGYRCEVAEDGKTGLAQALALEPDLILLDLMLPGMDGLSVCRKLRETSRVPILVLSARSSEADQILGFELGADDYVTKPFSIRLLKSRIRALLRRLDPGEGKDPDEPPIEVDDLVIDLPRHRVTKKGVELDLTATEFSLLCHLATQPGRVFPREDLLETVWGHRFEGYSRTVDSHINRLRKKVEDDPSDPQLILTVFKVGYKFREGRRR